MEKDNDRLKQQLQQQQKENNDLKRGIDDERGRVRNLMNDVQKGREAQEQLKAAQAQLQNTENAIANLKQDLTAKSQQLNNLNEKIQQINQENALLVQEKNELQISMDKTEMLAQGQEEEVKYLNQLIKDQKEKIFFLENRFKQYASIEEKLKQQDHRIAVLMAEIERVNHLLKQAQQDAEEWKQKYARLELSMLEYRQIEMTNRDQGAKAIFLAGELEKLQRLLLEKQQECDKLKEQLILKEEETRSLFSQITVMNKKVEGSNDVLLRYLCLAVENERLTNKIQLGIEAQQELLMKIKQLTIDFNELRAKTEGIDLNNIQKMKNQYEEKIARLEIEIQQSKSRLNSNTGGSGNVNVNGYQQQGYQQQGSQQQGYQQQQGNQYQQGYNSETQQYQQQNQQNQQYGGKTNLTKSQGDDKNRSVSPFSGQGKEEKLRRKIQDLMCLIVMMSAELDYLRGVQNEEKISTVQVKDKQNIMTTQTTRINYMQNQRMSYQ